MFDHDHICLGCSGEDPTACLGDNDRPVRDGEPVYCPACGYQAYRPGHGCAHCGRDDEDLSRFEPGPWNEVR